MLYLKSLSPSQCFNVAECVLKVFLFVGAQMLCVAENRHLKTSKSSVARIVDRFLEAMLKRKDQFIFFPNTNEAIAQYKTDFFVYSGFPNTIAAIDGSQFDIACPRCPDAIQYYNRKGRPSINVSVCTNIIQFHATTCSTPSASVNGAPLQTLKWLHVLSIDKIQHFRNGVPL